VEMRYVHPRSQYRSENVGISFIFLQGWKLLFFKV